MERNGHLSNPSESPLPRGRALCLGNKRHACSSPGKTNVVEPYNKIGNIGSLEAFSYMPHCSDRTPAPIFLVTTSKAFSSYLVVSFFDRACQMLLYQILRFCSESGSTHGDVTLAICSHLLACVSRACPCSLLSFPLFLSRLSSLFLLLVPSIPSTEHATATKL